MLKRLFFIALVCSIGFLCACCRGKKTDMDAVLPSADQSSAIVVESTTSEARPSGNAENADGESSVDVPADADPADADPAGNDYLAFMFVAIIAAIIVGVYLRKKKIL